MPPPAASLTAAALWNREAVPEKTLSSAEASKEHRAADPGEPSKPAEKDNRVKEGEEKVRRKEGGGREEEGERREEEGGSEEERRRRDEGGGRRK